MVASALLASIGLLASLSSALEGVTLKQIRNPAFVRGPGHAFGQIRNAMNKWAPGSHQGRELESRATQGSVVNTPVSQGMEYVIPVSLGTPAQTLNLDLDTGSSDLWVFASTTAQNEVEGQIIYNPGKSSTSKLMTGATWNISYGDGSTSSGIVYNDIVSIGGVAAPGFPIEVALKVSPSFTEDMYSDGLIGFAFGTLNTIAPTKQSTFFEKVMPNLPNGLFTCDLHMNTPGTYTLGYIDPTLHSGTIGYTDVLPITKTSVSSLSIGTNPGFWMFTTTGTQIGAGKVDTTPIIGIADTGTTLLFLPSQVVTNYYASIKTAKYDKTQEAMTFPCKTVLPSLSIYIGVAANATTITIPGTYLNAGPTDNTNKTCVGGLQASESIGINIFGDTFLKAAYVVFDEANMQLGFATKQLN